MRLIAPWILMIMFLVAPAGGWAATADEPSAVDDPPAVMDGVAEDVDPTATAEDASADAAVDVSAASTQSVRTAPRVSATPRVGSLPFTGTDSRQIALLALLGVTLIGCGIASRQRAAQLH